MAALAGPRATCVRSVVRSSTFGASLTPLKTHRFAAAPLSRRSITVRIPPQHLVRTTTLSIRHASTAPAASPTPTPSAQSAAPEDTMTWDRFFDLRKKRRRINGFSSVILSIGTIAVAGPLAAQQDIDSWGAQTFGLDPVIVLGITTLTFGLGGWLAGPTLGGCIVQPVGRQQRLDQANGGEKSFFARIKRYRADPASSSPQNPIPDYYGEKIASVKDYRRWLKDQRAFNLKKDKNII